MTEIEELQLKISVGLEELAHLNRVELLGAISTSLVHELNQALTAILANGQVLKQQLHPGIVCTEEAQEIMNDVISDSLRMGQLISEIKSMLKPRGSRSEFVDVKHLVLSVQKILKSEFIISEVTLNTDFGLNLPSIVGDNIHLQQVLINIFLNAIESMENLEPGDRKIDICTRLSEANEVEICVRDCGEGIPDAAYAQILDPFFTTKQEGLGMGLSISHSLVQKLGGRLWGENNKGPGATFRVAFPLSVTVTKQQSGRHGRQDCQTSEEIDDVATVYIVDDDPSVLKAMARKVSVQGYKVETFPSAKEFLQRDQSAHRSCLLVDLHMPVMSGLELQAALNEQEYTLPIIFMTGIEDTPSGVSAMKQGAVDFLNKPIDDKELLTTIEQAIAIDQNERAAQALKRSADEKYALLTPREIEVMALVVAGLPNKLIALELGITDKTVKAHRGHMMKKINVRSVADLVRISQIVIDRK